MNTYNNTQLQTLVAHAKVQLIKQKPSAIMKTKQKVGMIELK